MLIFKKLYQNHNSYIIREYTFTNDGNADNSKTTIEYPDQNLNGVYFGFQYYLLPGGDRGHLIVDQHDDWAVYYGNQPGDTLRGLFYMFDGNADAGGALYVSEIMGLALAGDTVTNITGIAGGTCPESAGFNNCIICYGQVCGR